MADKQNQPAVLRQKVERLEALLAAEKAAHAKTFDNYRENLYRLVDAKLKLGRIQETLEQKT